MVQGAVFAGIPITEGWSPDPREVMRTGDRVRVDPGAAVIELLARAACRLTGPAPRIERPARRVTEPDGVSRARLCSAASRRRARIAHRVDVRQGAPEAIVTDQRKGDFLCRMTRLRDHDDHPRRPYGRHAGEARGHALNAGMAWWDMMLRMQRASMASFSVYSPGSDMRISASMPRTPQAATQVVPVGEERLNVATRTELGETTRIRRRVIASPVEQDVMLREERVVVERRPAAARPADATRGDVLTETVIEMTDSRQVPQVWKSVHVAEEVVLRREVTERKERVRETLRRDVVEVEHEGEARKAGRQRDRATRAGFRDAGSVAQDVGAAATAAAATAARERTEALADAARRATLAAVEEAAKPDAAGPHPSPAQARDAHPPGGEPHRDDNANKAARVTPPQPGPVRKA